MKAVKSRKIIRSSKHSLHFSNANKVNVVSHFLDSYAFATQAFIDFIWNNPIHWTTKINHYTFDIATLQLDCPSVLDYKLCQFPTDLSARALSSAITQALAIIASKTNEVRNIKFGAKQELAKPEPNQKKLLALQTKLISAMKRMQKPVINPQFFKAELSSKNVLFEDAKSANHFDKWLILRSIGFHEPIQLPIKMHKHCNQLKKQGFIQMASFLIGRNSIEIRWQKQVEPRTTGQVVGCDTGIRAVATLSNGNNNHNQFAVNGVSYDQVLKRLARKKPGSKNFQQTCCHRDTLLRAMLNRIDWTNIQTFCLEDNSKLKQVFKGNYLARHSWQTINSKLASLCETLGVQAISTRSAYRSQRCCLCGWTQKANRPSGTETFVCQKCNSSMNADLNASRNQIVPLPYIDLIATRAKQGNLTGFYWLPNEEFRVPREWHNSSKPDIEESSIK